MSYNKENVAKILMEYEDKPKRALAQANERKSEVYAKIPQVRELDDAISHIGLKYFAVAMEHPKDLKKRFEALKKENKDLRKAREELLKQNGFPKNYTQIRYECPTCKDTGYVGLEMCTCLRQRLVVAGFESSGVGRLIENQSFDSFGLDHYSKKPNPRTGYSDYQVMKGIYERCQHYVMTFSEKADSLLFIGGTGLGKTHLSSAIAKGVIEKGYDVVYESAPNVLSSFEKERFVNTEQELSSQRYFDCDLLIVDDLGTEYQGKNTTSVIYNLINTRIVMKKPTVISTNLDYKTLEKQYDSRIISRLFGEFSVMLFEGTDLRRMQIQ